MLYSAISHEGFASFRDADVRLEAFDKLVGEENGSKRFAPLRDLLVEGEASKPLEENPKRPHSMNGENE